MADDIKNSFSAVDDCLKVVKNMEDAGRLRSADRALIHGQFDGRAPYTAAEVEANNIQFNVNKLGGYRIAMDAIQQINGALLNKDKFFSLRCISGKKEKREEFGEAATSNINNMMKKGKAGMKHLRLMQNRNTSLGIDGIGAMVWMNNYDWMPKFIPLAELLIPEDTTLDLSDELGHFAFNVYLTPWQLNRLISGDKVDKGWNATYVRKIIASIPKVTNQIPGLYDTWNNAEVWEQLVKSRATYMNSDAAGKVKMSFVFEQGEKDGKWYRKVLFRKTDNVSMPESGGENDDAAKFMYDSGETPFADDIEQILHVQFGAGNVVAPLKFHNVRGLGVLLYAAVEADNRLYNQTLQATFFDLMQIFRAENPAQQERPKVLDLHNWAVLEQGISFVKSDERHNPDQRLLESTTAQNKQLIGESSSSYISDVDNGSEREQTLGEAQIKLQTSNRIVGATLSNIYWQEGTYYEEVKRRAFQKNPTDKDIKKFQERCEAAGIPKELMRPECWEVEVEKVFGMGDQTLAIQEVAALMNNKAQYDSSAQRTILRKYTGTITRNPDLAKELVPEDQNQSTSGRQAAEDVFGTLMEGIHVSLREGIEQQDYIIAMAEMMAAKIARIKELDNMGTPQDVIGLQTVEKDILAHLELLANNPAMKPLVSGMTKELGSMMNEVKAFVQRQQQKAEAEAEKSQQDPEAQAKVEALAAQTGAKLQSQAQTTAEKLKQSQATHQQKMRQSAETHAQKVAQDAAQTQADLAAKAATTQADILAKEKAAAAAPVVAE